MQIFGDGSNQTLLPLIFQHLCGKRQQSSGQEWPVSVVGCLHRDASRCWAQQHYSRWWKSAQHDQVLAMLSPNTPAATSTCSSFEGKCPDPKSGFVWDANPLIFHVCVGRGVRDNFTTLMAAEGYSSAGRTFRKHISFCRACDPGKHLVDIFLWSSPAILRIYKPWAANHWQNHSFTIFWLRNNSSSLLWCFPVRVSWGQDFSTEKAIGPHPFKGKMVPLSWYRVKDV